LRWPSLSKKKINGMDAKCLAFGQPTVTYCIDSATNHLLSVDGDLFPAGARRAFALASR